MPVYEYYCETCRSGFEVRRAMSDADSPSACPEGHSGAKRALSLFATVTSGGSAMPMDDAGCGRCGAPEPGSCAFN